MEEKIKLLREKLIERLSSLEDGMHVKLDYDPILLDMILFNKDASSLKTFALPENILEKIDFSNVSFMGFNAKDYDFGKLYGIKKINPQQLYEKDLSNAKFKNVRFIGPFDDTIITGADFTGSVGAYINVILLRHEMEKFLWTKHIYLTNCKFNGVNFTDVITKGEYGSYIDMANADFTGSTGAVIDANSVELTKVILKDTYIKGKIHGDISYADFTGAKSKNSRFDSRIKIDPADIESFEGTKLSGVVLTNSFSNSYLKDTDFTGSIGATIDLRTIGSNSDYKSCNYTDSTVIGLNGEYVSISEDGKLTTNILKSIDEILQNEKEYLLLNKKSLEEARKKLIEENKRKVQEKINELVKLLDATEKLGIEPKKLYGMIPIGREELLVNIDDHYEINRNFVENLRFFNLSLIDFTNVKVSGIDFRGSAARINPQTVYNKDLSDCNFEGIFISPFVDFSGVNIKGAKFSVDSDVRTVDVFNNTFRNAIYDENTTYNGIPLVDLLDSEKQKQR